MLAIKLLYIIILNSLGYIWRTAGCSIDPSVMIMRKEDLHEDEELSNMKLLLIILM